MKSILFLLIVLFFAIQLSAQKDSVKTAMKENLSEAAKDSIKEAKLESVMVYPIIKSCKSAGVLPVPVVDEKQDPNLQYKILFTISSVEKDKMYNINDQLSEVARTINLHAAAGIPQTHVHVVVIVFRQGLNTLLKDDVYKEKFNTPNPNIELIKELENAGVTFISCGQSMYRTGIKKELILPSVKVSISARTAMSYYNSMGYGAQ